MQTYGKGTAADCRRHVQKLNMMRAEKEQLENEQLRSSPGSHPPEDYADTFTAQVKPSEEIVSEGHSLWVTTPYHFFLFVASPPRCSSWEECRQK